MNTAKIAALYPYFLNALQQVHTGRSLEDLLSILLRSRPQRQEGADAPRLWVKLRDNENPVLRYTELGTTTDEELAELVPARAFEWVCRQMPAEPIYTSLAAEYEAHLASEKTGWKVTAHEMLSEPTGITGQPVPDQASGGTGRYLRCTGPAHELAVLLRGLFALRTKRRKQLRRLVAQLHAYHAQQLAAEAQHAELLAAVNTSPLLPHYGITRAEYARRIDAADNLAQQLREQYNRPDAYYGYEIMWHPDFAAACVESFSQMELSEVEYFLSGDLVNAFYRDQPLDYADYAYLADCLREGLADNPTPLAALRLTRALAWVEQAGAALRPTAQPHLTALQSEAAPALAA